MSLFAGIGGMDVGAHKYNIPTRYANDYHNASQQFYENNYPDTVFDCCDVRLVNLKRINEKLAERNKELLIPGEFAVLTAGSPCVKMSGSNTIDARQFAEENYLMIETVPNLVKELMPKIVWMENSDRFMSKANVELRHEYLVRLEYFLDDYEYQIQVMNAPRYGGFQTRSRAMVVMVRKDILNGRNISFFPPKEKIDLTKQGAHALLPDIASFWHGQFDEVYKPTLGNIFCTLTASGREYVIDHAGNKMLLGVERKKILSDMTGYDYTGICDTSQTMLLGNMVQPQISERMFKRFTEVILK